MVSAPLGRAYVEVKADLTGFATDVRAKLAAAMKEGTAGLDFGLEEKLKQEADQGIEDAAEKLEQELPKRSKKAGSDSGSGFWSGFKSAFHVGIAAFLPTLIAYGVEMAASLLPAVYALSATIPTAILSAVAAAGTLALAFHGIGAAIGAAFSGDPEKLAQAMAKLPPAAREFVMEINKARPALVQLQKDVQNVFFIQLEGSITRLTTALLPTLHVGLLGIAADLGKMGSSLANALVGSKGDLAKVFQNTRLALQPLIPLLGQFAAAFIKIAAAAGPFVITMSKGLADIANKFLTAVNNATQNGGLERIFQDAYLVLSDFGGLLKQVLGLVGEVLGVLGATGDEAIGTLGFVVQELKDFFATAAGNDALAAIFGLLNVALGTLGQVLQPLLPVIGELVTQLANGLADALLQLTPSLVNVAAGAAQLLKWLSPLIPAASELIKALVPIIQWLTSSPGVLAAAAAGWAAYKVATEAATAAQIAFDIAEDANPVGAIVLAIEAVIAAVVLLIYYWKDVSKWAVSAWHSIVDAWNAVWAFFVDIGKNIGVWVYGVITWFQALPDRIIAFVQGIPAMLENLFQQAIEGVAYIIGFGIGTWLALLEKAPGAIFNALVSLGGLLVNLMQDALTGVWNTIVANWNIILAYVEALPGRIVGALLALPGLLVGFFNNMWDQAKHAFFSGADAVIDFARGLPGRLGNFFSGAGSSILNSLKSGINDVIRAFNSGIDKAAGPLHAVLPHIPYLADGAVVKSPTLAMIGEAGSEVVIPLGNPKRAQELAEQSGLTKMLLSGLQSPTINFTAVLGTGEILTVLDQRVSLANADTSQSIAFGARRN